MKVYSCKSEISRSEFMKFRRNSGVLYYILLVAIITIIVMRSSGDVEWFITVPIIAIIIITVMVETGKSACKGYRKEQSISFSEDGIKNEEDATYVHWTNLGKARQKNGWIMVSHVNRVFFIKLDRLSPEEEHFLRKRLRGLKK